jgi:hypothetical protein
MGTGCSFNSIGFVSEIHIWRYFFLKVTFMHLWVCNGHGLLNVVPNHRSYLMIHDGRYVSHYIAPADLIDVDSGNVPFHFAMWTSVNPLGGGVFRGCIL